MASYFTEEERTKLIDFVQQNELLSDGLRNQPTAREKLWNEISDKSLREGVKCIVDGISFEFCSKGLQDKMEIVQRLPEQKKEEAVRCK